LIYPDGKHFPGFSFFEPQHLNGFIYFDYSCDTDVDLRELEAIFREDAEGTEYHAHLTSSARPDGWIFLRKHGARITLSESVHSEERHVRIYGWFDGDHEPQVASLLARIEQLAGQQLVGSMQRREM
jgi:hypothetical protein